jgi:hypothetical protein
MSAQRSRPNPRYEVSITCQHDVGYDMAIDYPRVGLMDVLLE